MIFARVAFAIGLATSFAAAEDVRRENNRQAIAALTREHDLIEERLVHKGLLADWTTVQLRQKLGQLRTEVQTNIADLRRGVIRRPYQDLQDRRRDAAFWGLPWNMEWNEDLGNYFQAFLNYANQLIQDTDRLQKIEEQRHFHQERLKELNCSQNAPKVEPLPGDAERPVPPVSTPRVPAGSLVLISTDIKPAHEDVGGVGNLRSKFTNSSTTADIDHIETTTDGKMVSRIRTHFDYAITSSGNSYALRPGDTITVTIAGRDNRTPMNTAGGYGVTGSVHQSGLQPVTEKPCWVGSGFRDGYHAACSGEYVFQVTPGHDKVSLSFAGDFGIGDAVTFTWAKSR